MEILPLSTVWEAKERAGLLALETPDWREKRLLAENPNATAAVLAQLTDFVESYDYHVDIAQYFYDEVGLITEALLAHPNTPPVCMICLLQLFTLHGYRSFCRNPVVPFLVLEKPDFWKWAYESTWQRLLCEEDLPLAAVHTFSRSPSEAVVEAAPFHIAIAGKIQSQAEGVTALHDFGFPQFVVNHHLPTDLGNLRSNGTSRHWKLRLYAALQLPLIDEPFPKSSQVPDEDQELWNRSPLDLMYHLARDGNRLVRWAAQTRRSDPHFKFVWHEYE